MEDKKDLALEILKKHLLNAAKEMGIVLAIPELEKVKQDILDKKIDLIKDVEYDNVLAAQVVQGVINELKKLVGQ